MPLGFPALTRALKLQKRAARVGFDWGAAAPILAKLQEEIASWRRRIAAGAARRPSASSSWAICCSPIVNLARHLEIDPEAALRATNAKFERRFRSIEAAAARQGRTAGDMTLDELEALWERAKREERR